MFRLTLEFQYRDMEEPDTRIKDFDTHYDAVRAGDLLADFICGDDCSMTFNVEEVAS